MAERANPVPKRKKVRDRRGDTRPSGFPAKLGAWLEANRLAYENRRLETGPRNGRQLAAHLTTLGEPITEAAVGLWRRGETLPAGRYIAHLERLMGAPYGLYVAAGIDLEDLPAGSRGWHLLRHSYATLLGASGADVATIGRLLGHRPGSPVTLRYIHPDDGRLRKAAEAVERALG